jgi:hypothetical protein
MALVGFVCYALGSTVAGLTGSSAKPRKPRRQPSAKEKALQETNKKRMVKSETLFGFNLEGGPC